MAQTVDQIIIELMRSGVVTRNALIGAGASASSIDRRRRSGLLVPVCEGIYIVPTQTEERSPLIAALAALPDAAISRESAGRLHHFPVRSTSAHVTVGYGRRRTVEGVTVHETRRWLDGDIVDLDGLRVTSPARTLIDLAANLSTHRLRHVTETQLIKKLPQDAELLATFTAHRRRGRTGTTKMAAILVELLDDQPHPESVLEVKVWRALLSHQLTAFRRQFRPSWYDGRTGIVDFAHPEARLILEADGRRWHAVTQAQHDDHRRDRRAVAAGWAVIRVGWAEIETRPFATMQEIASVVSNRLTSPVLSAEIVAHDDLS